MSVVEMIIEDNEKKIAMDHLSLSIMVNSISSEAIKSRVRLLRGIAESEEAIKILQEVKF